MSQLIEVKVPDIGDFDEVPVIELFVKVGDTIKEEEAICTLESDKATMDVPSSASGVVKEVLVKLGDKVSEGSVLIKIEAADAAVAAQPAAAPAAAPAPAPAPAPAAPAAAASGGVVEVKVPDIGDFDEVPVIELFVKVGDTIKEEEAIATLESDKATMDVPSSVAGKITEVLVKLGDKVSEGTVLIKVESAAGPAAAAEAPKAAAAAPAPSAAPAPAPAAAPAPAPAAASPAASGPSPVAIGSSVHASPSVRAYARELGVDLSAIKPTGPKNRVLREDVTAFVKGAMSSGVVPGKTAAAAPASGGGAGLDLLPWPKVDFAKFGEVEVKPLSRIKKISGANLHRNWVMIPHVTQYDETDVTDLEAFRVMMNKDKETEKLGVRYTMLAFVVKACVAALKKYPQFNSSMDGDNLVFKKYYNIGFAADTPNGLVVPVLKNADTKSVTEIALEMGALSKKARDGKLGPAEMQGGTFSISSLGGIGGTYFTPLINAPEVAIIGLSKLQTKPMWDGEKFVPRQILPLSLSYDHRIIDGAEGARFVDYIGKVLADMRRTLL